MDIQAILWIFAFVLFVIAAFFSPPRVNLIAGGLAFFVAGFLAGAL